MLHKPSRPNKRKKKKKSSNEYVPIGSAFCNYLFICWHYWDFLQSTIYFLHLHCFWVSTMIFNIFFHTCLQFTMFGIIFYSFIWLVDSFFSTSFWIVSTFTNSFLFLFTSIHIHLFSQSFSRFFSLLYILYSYHSFSFVHSLNSVY